MSAHRKAPSSYDLVIVGGGLAGLSLAYRLCDPRFRNLRVAVVEPRLRYDNDKTWCYWRTDPHPFEDCVSASWSAGNVQASAFGESPVAIDLTNTPYQRIVATDFYAKSLQRIAATSHVELMTGMPVLAVQTAPDGMLVTTRDAALTGRIVFDARPPACSPAAWSQVFAGWEIETDDALFDPRAFTLMDFEPAPENRGLSFCYLLPLSPRRALLQATRFVPPAQTVPDYASLDRQAHDYFGRSYGQARFDTVREEFGLIPMDPLIPAPRCIAAHTPIGARGGFIRAATGYSFSRTQRACDAIAAGIADWMDGSKLPIALHWQDVWTGFADRTFLNVIGRQDRHAYTPIRTLFERAPTANVVRFLDGHSSLSETLSVITTLPWGQFLAGALRPLARKSGDRREDPHLLPLRTGPG